MIDDNRLLFSGFMRSCEKYPERPALEVDHKIFSYRELYERAANIAVTLEKHISSGASPFVAVLASRSITVYAGILGTIMGGRGCVPISPKFPASRIRLILQTVECPAVLVDSSVEPLLDEILTGFEKSLILILPESKDVTFFVHRWPQHIFLQSDDLESHKFYVSQSRSADSIAYILFTSGSTGTPKGVMISHRNILSFIDAAVDRYSINEFDRFAQLVDTTADMSMFDLFVAWECGACVCVPPEKEVLNPRTFFTKSRITVFYTVPFNAIYMKTMGSLKPNQFPLLRWCLFAGEILTAEIAKACSDSAPNAIVENLYGPTELTISCTWYRWDPLNSPEESERGNVPIGFPFPGMKILIVDETLQEVQEGNVGELLMTGSLLTLGYWKNTEKTAAAYVIPPGKDETYYRTGDYVRRPIGDNPIILFGRMDNQVKLTGGIRVELGEIEYILREEANVDMAVALGWPVTSTGVGGIVAFIQNPAADLEEIYAKVSSRLPKYMVPKKIIPLSEFPINPNRKIDRKSLLKWLQENPI